jgi:hypothetical protein
VQLFTRIFRLPAQRLQRNTPSGGRHDISQDLETEDDVESELLENLSLAGLRFDQLLRRSLRIE